MIPVAEPRRLLHRLRRQLRRQERSPLTTHVFHQLLRLSIASVRSGLALVAERSSATVWVRPAPVRKFFTAIASFMCSGQIPSGIDGVMDGLVKEPLIPVAEQHRRRRRHQHRLPLRRRHPRLLRRRHPRLLRRRRVKPYYSKTISTTTRLTS